MKLPPEMRINNGVAPAVYTTNVGKSVYMPTSKNVLTNTLKGDSENIDIDGIKLELNAADGETSDHIIIWYPAQKVLFAGDLIYKSFPNLYAIRGTPYRNVKGWIDALNFMLSKDAEVLVLGHTQPITGKEKVREVLTNYRDAIKFVLDKTIEGINKGMTPDELVEYVKLPERFANDDFLGEYYGRVDWSVRQIFNGYLGWFDGNPTNLKKLSPKSEAEEFAKLVGGEVKLFEAAKDAYAQEKYQWCAQLCDRLLAININNQEYKNLKASALEELAPHTLTATMRNYYLTCARELRGLQ